MSRDYGAWAARWRVPLGFAFAIVYLIVSRPTLPLLVAGGIVALAGLSLRAWAAGHIEKNRRLAIEGPFASTRNPLYLGSLILGIGFIIAAASWLLGAAFIALFVAIYLPVMRREENHLREEFGPEFDAYALRVPLFFPGLARGPGATERFRWEIYRRNREYNVAIGYTAIVIFLVFKLMLR